MGGAAIGLDLPAVLNMAEAFGYDRQILAQLLPSAEAGMVTGISKRTSDDQPISGEHGSINA